MKITAEICVIPMGVGVSVSGFIAACQPILEEAGLNPIVHAYGTNVEGEWDDVFAAFKQCHQTIHDLGAPRVFTTIKLGSRSDRDQTNQDKLDSVRAQR
ncbi:membrane lipoprotein [Salinisphaera shabanensis E1L3A]|uniref:Membrane lipoprotein n=1 Tax=Salinisphaera shabanensis E1L3A TaxID=1033802 RepID=U2FV66_9GAMM|nr:MTH1187 family thiamine-binding protein [Salinisphaera shabanensis]ERJ19814.1 membrane lipoprotein [Salinisphaera shabanensis E1L3A]